MIDNSRAGEVKSMKVWSFKLRMSPGSTDSLEDRSPTELVGLVRRLIGEFEQLRQENEKLTAALASSRRENQLLKDEVRRLKGLPPRPPFKPSGMEKATDRSAAEQPGKADPPPEEFLRVV